MIQVIILVFEMVFAMKNYNAKQNVFPLSSLSNLNT